MSQTIFEQPTLPGALTPQGEIFYTTLDDPEGIKADAAADVIRRQAHLACAPCPILDRPENFYVMATVKPDSFYVQRYLPDAIRYFERELERSDYPDPVKLAFDPAKTEDEQFKRIWSDEIARAVWIGLRYRRVTNQHFKDHVESIAASVKKRLGLGVLSRTQLRGMFSWNSDIFGSEELTGLVALRLFPYLVGEKVFRFEVEEAE